MSPDLWVLRAQNRLFDDTCQDFESWRVTRDDLYSLYRDNVYKVNTPSPSSQSPKTPNPGPSSSASDPAGVCWKIWCQIMLFTAKLQCTIITRPNSSFRFFHEFGDSPQTVDRCNDASAEEGGGGGDERQRPRPKGRRQRQGAHAHEARLAL